MKKTFYFLIAALLGNPFAIAADRPLSSTRITEVLRQGDARELNQLLADGLSPNHADDSGETLLMKAALYGGTDTFKLLLDRGAEVNATNKAGATALMRAAGQFEKIRLLVGKGANVNARSALGNTPVMLAARPYGSHDAVALLIKAGAEINGTNVFGANALMAACASGDLRTVRLLLNHGADANSHIDGREAAVIWGGGRSPLMWAAVRGDIALAKLLLKHGAEVNSPNGFNNALSQAAWTDQTAAARFLLDRGADVNQKDAFSGFSPLHWAASSESGDPQLVKLLLKHGADPNAEGGEPVDAYMGIAQTPLMLAQRRGPTAIADALLAAGAKPVTLESKKVRTPPRELPAQIDPVLVRRALGAALPGLQETAISSKDSFVRHNSKQDCVSCHQQYLPMTALALARRSGATVKPEAEAQLLEMVRKDNQNLSELTLQATFHPEPAHGYGYALFALSAQEQKPDAAIDAAIHHLLAVQGKDGRWYNNLPRPPLQSSDVGATALAVQALAAYPFPARQAEFAERIERARSWLRKVKPTTNEERIYQILGLAHASESPARLRKLGQALLAEQRFDGGWSQLPMLESDAYATGQALFALQTARISTQHDQFQRGLAFLVRTQLDDGTWFVARRAFPFQPTMKSGYPHGRDGWISASGASWAVMALARALENGLTTGKALAIQGNP